MSSTSLAAAAFDPGDPLLLHAVGSDGGLLALDLGNAVSLLGCRVRQHTVPSQQRKNPVP